MTQQLCVCAQAGYAPAVVHWPAEPSLFDLPELDVQVMEVTFWSAARGWVVLTPVRRGWPGRTEVLPSDLMRVRELQAAGRTTVDALREIFGALQNIQLEI